MWEFFIKNNKFAYLFLIGLVAVGTYSLVAIPKESSPEVLIPIGIVTTVLPGAPAADIETLITNEIERGLTSLNGVSDITSTSQEGVSTVVVEFNADADVDDSIQELKDEIDLIKPDLPSEANDPTVSKIDFQNEPVLTVALAADLTDLEFTQLSNDLEREIESVPGVSRVEFAGVRDREVTVIVNQESLEQFSLSLSDVTSALQQANRTFPIGQIVNNGISYNVAFEGDITDSSEIKNIGIATREGQPVFVRDIAIVEDGLSPASSLSRLSLDGNPSVNSISLSVYKQSGGDITRIVGAVHDKISELQKSGEILDGIEASTVLDSGEQIQSDLIQLSTSGLQTVVLVVIMLVVAIGWREGLLAGLAIPLSFLFGFIGLFFSGNSINFLSLFSLILGIGILVDSAIVMIEGINRKMKDDVNIDKREAAISTIREFAAPLISGTLTTVSMFVGLFIVSGVIGQFIFSIPFTLIFLLFASLFVSLAIIPLFAAAFLKRRSNSNFERKQVEKAHQLESWYRSKLDQILGNTAKEDTFTAGIAGSLIFCLFLTFNLFAGVIAGTLVYLTYKWRYVFVRNLSVRPLWKGVTAFGLWIATTAGSIVIGVVVASAVLPTINPVKVIFFEQSDVDYIIVEIESQEGTVKEMTDIATRRVEELLYDEEEIESFTVTVGSGSAFGSQATGEKFANLFVTLTDDRKRTSTEIMEDLRAQTAAIRDVKVTVNQPSDGPPTGAAIIVKFLGEDLDELTSLANQAANVFKGLPNTINVETSTNNNSTEFVLVLDKAKATALGVSPFQVSQVARTAIFGTDATSLTTLQDDIDVVVKLNVNNNPDVTSETSNVTSIDALERITIATQSGPVPLSSLVDVELRESSSVISHEDGKRVVTITADVDADGNPREIQALALEKIQSDLNIPEGIELSTGGGETDESNQAFAEMIMALGVGVLLMIGVLTLQFNSYRFTVYVLSILPYSLIGIFVGLAITASSLSFPSIMGFIALSGIVVNNSILLIDMMNQMRRKDPEKPISEIVSVAAGNRLRPILLTTVTTIIGMIPLTYAGDLWAPLAYAVMFGLLFSVCITLVLIPIIYNRKPGVVAK